MKVMIRQSAGVVLDIYPEAKYHYKGEPKETRKYECCTVSSFQVLEGTAAEMMCTMLDMEQTKELLMVYFNDGHTEVYDNAKCDLFVM